MQFLQDAGGGKKKGEKGDTSFCVNPVWHGIGKQEKMI